MEKVATFSIADILTPQEHNWIGSSSPFTPTNNKEWFIPNGVLRGTITLEGIIEEREAKGHIESMLDPLGIVTRGTSEAMVISLEEINPETRQTKDDPKILGVMDDEAIRPKPIIDKATGEVRNLTEEFIKFYTKKGLEKELHLRPNAIGEKENTSIGEGNINYKT